MGYKIPPPDFTMPPDTFNVGEEVGKIFGEGLKDLGAAVALQSKKAQENIDAQDAAKNEILRSQATAKLKFKQSLKDQGIVDDDKEDPSLFDQFSNVLDTKADQALNATMALNFGSFNSDDKITLDLGDGEKEYTRAQLTEFEAKFETYADSGMKEFGNVTADAEKTTDPDFIVVGNTENGEQLNNTLMLQAMNQTGNDASAFGEGAILKKELNEKDGENSVSTTIKIPVNSEWIKNADNNSNGSISKQIGAAIIGDGISKKYGGPGGAITKETGDDGTEYYVFKNNINVSTYGQPGGQDYTYEAVPLLDPETTLTEVGAMTDGGWDAKYKSLDVVSDVQDSGDGMQTTTNYNLIDVGNIYQDQAYQAKIHDTYETIFTDESVGYSDAQRDRYLDELGIPQSWSEISKMSPEAAKNLIGTQMMRKQVNGYFTSEGKPTSSPTDRLVTVKPGDALYEQVKNNPNMIDPFSGKPYAEQIEAGKNIQVYAQVSQSTKKKSEESVNVSDMEQRFSNLLNNPAQLKQAAIAGIQLPNVEANLYYDKETGKYYTAKTDPTTKRVIGNTKEDVANPLDLIRAQSGAQ